MMPISNKIAKVVEAESTRDQALFRVVASRWRAAGAKVAGVIAEPYGLPGRSCSAGILRDISTGQPYTIYLDSAPSDTSCHLDAAGVDAACANLVAQIETSDLVVLSKFGRLEAMGKRMAKAFATATAADKPVLTTISGKHREAWVAFAPHAAHLTADEATLQAWWKTVRAN